MVILPKKTYKIMVKVYFESGGRAELRAIFRDENLYIKCFKELETQAKRERMFVTESVIDDIELKNLVK